MKTKVVTVLDEFKDFRGLTHKFVVAAVSEEVDAVVDIYDYDGNIEDCSSITKIVKLGVAICNPNDEYDEKKGKMIAINKAHAATDYALYATLPGMINTAVVEALVKQEVAFIKENPNRVIPGYAEEKQKFESRQKLQAQLDSLSPEEKEFYDAVKGHWYPKAEALLNT